jgi:tyrosyl-tRNA synthetase
VTSTPLPVEQAFAQISRNTSDIVTEAGLRQVLELSQKESRPLRVKFGIDPTFTHVHIGHAVPIRLLHIFQQLGHLPVLIIGDGTARLGDPTGRNDQRPPLSKEEVAHNSATYLEQIGKILDLSSDVCEVRYNSEWFAGMDFFDCLRLASRGTAARLLERDDFKKRMSDNLPVHLHEMLYPLMQGWDSVQVESDIEIGGNDQLFNLHMGRLLQEREGQSAQVCLTTPLLLGTDGRKMSKTYGNHVPLLAPANDMFGKVMSLSDEQMSDWFRLLTPLTDSEIQSILEGHPREAKGRLASEVVSWLHDASSAEAAADSFKRQFGEKKLPDEIPECKLESGLALANLLKEAGLVGSTSDARRMIQQGAVKVNGEQASDPNEAIPLGETPTLLQVGKRRFSNAIGV